MGLAINVGMLAWYRQNDEEAAAWYEQSLEAVNRCLTAQGLPAHDESEKVQDDSRASLTSFPYSFIHYLRRAYAHRNADPQWIATPLQDSIDPGEDPLLRQYYAAEILSHLVCHSDAEGFYVPVDFPDVIFDDELPGGMLGSSQQLMRELVLVAPALGVRLENGRLSDEEAARIDSLLEEDEGLYRELSAWILLFECARVSVEQVTAISFS
jgi:hypothetical protein